MLLWRIEWAGNLLMSFTSPVGAKMYSGFYISTVGAEVCIDTVLAFFCSLLFGKVQL